MQCIESIRDTLELFRAPKAQEVFETHIRRDATVVIGGPAESPKYDAGLLWAAYWLAPGGKIFIADPQSTGDDPTYSQSYDRKFVIGIGDVSEYKSYLDILRGAGQALAKPDWLGRQSTLWNMPELADNSMHHILDHYTSVFLLRVLALPMRENRDLWRRILAEYHRVLRPGGTLLLQSHMRVSRVDGVFSSHHEIMHQMNLAGFRVSHQMVQDGLRVPMPNDVFVRLKKPGGLFGPDDAKRVADLASSVRIIRGVPTIMPLPYYPSPDVYIAEKV